GVAGEQIERRLRDLPSQGGVLGEEIHLQNAQQHDHRADQRVKKEFDRRVQPVFSAPNSNQEVHRHQRDFEEQIEQKQIHRSEDAQHHRLQEQQQNVIFLLALLDVLP